MVYNEHYPGWGKIIDDNPDLTQVQNGVCIRLLERGGRVHVMIEVGEDVIEDDLKKVIPLACRWRDRVMDYQGAWRAGGKNEFLERLSRMQEGGEEWAQLAERINKSIENHLKEYLAYRQEVDTVHPEERAKHDKDIFYHVFWLGMDSNPAALSFTKDLLEGLHFKQQEILEIIKNGLEALSREESIFLKDYPVTKSKMIQVLRTWRNGKKHKSIQKQEVLAKAEHETQRDSTV